MTGLAAGADDVRPEVWDRVEVTEDDIDSLGHLNQARYHDYLGATRRRLLDVAAVPENPVAGRFVVARVELDHHREVLREDGPVDVHAQIVRVGRKSITIANEVVRPDGIVAAGGIVTMVAWDPERRCSRVVTPTERAAYGG